VLPAPRDARDAPGPCQQPRCRIQDVHWFVGGTGDAAKSYYRKNRVGFEFGDVDGTLMDRCFMIGGKTFFHQLPIKDMPHGKGAPAHSLGFHIDQCWIEDVNNGFIFEGACGFVLSSANILLRKDGLRVSVIPNSLFYNAVISGVQVRSFGQTIVGFEYDTKTPHPRNCLSIADCQLFDGSPALHLGPGAIRANVHDNHYNQQRPLRAGTDRRSVRRHGDKEHIRQRGGEVGARVVGTVSRRRC